MSKRAYRCEGCGATLETKDDLTREQRVTGSTWYCRYCMTSLPGVVGEKLKHRE